MVDGPKIAPESDIPVLGEHEDEEDGLGEMPLSPAFAMTQSAPGAVGPNISSSASYGPSSRRDTTTAFFRMLSPLGDSISESHDEAGPTQLPKIKDIGRRVINARRLVQPAFVKPSKLTKMQTSASLKDHSAAYARRAELMEASATLDSMRLRDPMKYFRRKYWYKFQKGFSQSYRTGVFRVFWLFIIFLLLATLFLWGALELDKAFTTSWENSHLEGDDDSDDDGGASGDDHYFDAILNDRSGFNLRELVWESWTFIIGKCLFPRIEAQGTDSSFFISSLLQIQEPTSNYRAGRPLRELLVR